MVGDGNQCQANMKIFILQIGVMPWLPDGSAYNHLVSVRP